MDKKTNFTVVRNAAYMAGSIGVRERHNERKNESYYNSDIIPERTPLNVRFHQNFSPNGMPETYEQTFKRLLENGTVVKRGLKADAKVFDELVFDVNTSYFEENGGYDFAKKFYEEAYRLAVKEIGGEEYILSAVMHADERNSGLSAELGRDVYHYHLHVIYVPVVAKEILWSKRCKDPELVGTVKEVIPQISHSKKWPKFKDETGKWVNSYSLLQDRFYEHMGAAGFDGFERGKLGSKAEHLSVREYKSKQEQERLNKLKAQSQEEKRKLDSLIEATGVRKGISAAQVDIDNMARTSKSGKNKIVSNADWEVVSTMAKRCAVLDEKTKDMAESIKVLQRDLNTWKARYNRLWNEVKDFIYAIRTAPQKLLSFICENKLRKTKNREDTR